MLIATDVAARGLDIPNVEHVIHYQVPRTSEVCLKKYKVALNKRNLVAYNIGEIIICLFILL